MSHETPVLGAARRELLGKKSVVLRKQGLAPAVLYGYAVEPTSIQIDVREFEAVYRQAGRTALLDLNVGQGRPVKVFVQDVQRHPVNAALLHVDFHAVNLREAITSDVPIILVGEAPAVHNNIGVLLRGVETVSVHALPAELPQQIEMSIESLRNVDDAIHVSDLPTAPTYQIEADPSEVVVKIAAQQLEPEIAEVPAEETGDAEQPSEVAEQG